MKIMKSFYLGLLFTFGMTFALTAQTVDQGTWMIGGSASFSSTKVKNVPASTILDLSPKFGLFIIDDLAVGLGISFKSTSADTSSNSTFGLGPFVRYYLTDPIFVQAGVDLGLEDNSATSFNLSLGYSWFVDNTVAIEPALFFSSVNYDGESSDATIFGLSIGIQAFPGR
jgi:hypothetical protein